MELSPNLGVMSILRIGIYLIIRLNPLHYVPALLLVRVIVSSLRVPFDSRFREDDELAALTILIQVRKTIYCCPSNRHQIDGVLHSLKVFSTEPRPQVPNPRGRHLSTVPSPCIRLSWVDE